MKKFLLFLGMSSMVLGMQAQSTVVTAPATKVAPAKHMMFDKAKFAANKGAANASRAVPESFWLNYGTSQDQMLGGGPGSPGPAVLNSNYLFPDSLCFGEFGAGNFSGVWIHHLADMLDVKSQVFNIIDGVTWTAATAYSVDSLSILYGYTRMDPNPLVIDTLVVTMFTNATAANNPSSGFIGTTATNYLTDTVTFKNVKYTQPTNLVNAAGTYKFKILLTASDTAATFYREKMFAVPVPFNVPAGKLLSTDVQFIPGYSYALGDHIDYVHNAFFFTSYEEQGAGTFPTFYDCNYQSVNCDYNTSYILPQDVRYNNAATWNGLFIPAYAYTVGYAFEHHLISYKVTNPPTDIDELNANFSLEQNQPNPFTNATTINYHMKKSADRVSLQIYDVRGVKVYETSTSNVRTGSYSVDVQNDFTPGMYFYTLEVDGAKATKKMIVQ
jgi:type IX secretion system substrate protein